MSKFISQVQYNPWNNGIVKTIKFGPGLNIISGTNGTGKTKLLQFIQQNNGNPNVSISDGTSSINLSAFSPQRNAQKVLAQQAMQLFRQDVNATQNTINIFKSVIQDDGFQTLKSISEYFVYLAEETVKADDVKPSESAAKIKSLFEDAIKKIFDFDIKFDLNRESKIYELTFDKKGSELSPQQLSHGENAIIVLVCALIFGLDSSEAFLIDEPEIHLNWSLEEKLFKFLDEFATSHDRQIIVVTHSRVAFLDTYKGKRQFFERNGHGIVISENPSEWLTKQIAGDTVQLLQGITAKTRLVYVEDTATKTILDAIAERLSLEVDVEIAGDRQKVLNVSNAFKNRGISNVYFLIDNDNKPLSAKEKGNSHSNTIQLKKYCIENYLLQLGLLQTYRKQDWETPLKSYIGAIPITKSPGIRPVQIALEKGAPVTEIIDYIDGSMVFERLAEAEGKASAKYAFMVELVNSIPGDQLLSTYFADLDFLQSS